MQQAQPRTPNGAPQRANEPAPPLSSDLEKVIRKLNGLANIISPTQPLDIEGREYLSDQLQGFVEDLKRLALVLLVGKGMLAYLVAM